MWFERAYYDTADQYVSHYAMTTPLQSFGWVFLRVFKS